MVVAGVPEGPGRWSGEAMGNERGRGNRAQTCEKVVFSTERTQGFVGNKGLIGRRVAKTVALLMPNERKLKPKRGQNSVLFGFQEGFADRKSAAGPA
jgi:hypothetical protein